MTLTPKENQIILDHMYLARIEARRQLKYFGNSSLEYDDACSIGYMVITEIVSKGRYKGVVPLIPFLIKSVRYAVQSDVRSNWKYELIEENRQLEKLLEDTQDTEEHKNTDAEFDYAKARELLLFLPLEEQKIMKYSGKGLTLESIGKKLHMSRKAIANRIRKIKTKMRKEYYE